LVSGDAEATIGKFINELIEIDTALKSTKQTRNLRGRENLPSRFASVVT
jgi:hypothetical protein